MTEKDFIRRMKAWGWKPVRSLFPGVLGNIYAWERAGCRVEHGPALKHWQVTNQLPQGVKSGTEN